MNEGLRSVGIWEIRHEFVFEQPTQGGRKFGCTYDIGEHLKDAKKSWESVK